MFGKRPELYHHLFIWQETFDQTDTTGHTGSVTKAIL